MEEWENGGKEWEKEENVKIIFCIFESVAALKNTS